MAKKKTKKTAQNRSPHHAIYSRIPPDLGAALEAYVASVRPEPTVASVLRMFIEDGLRKVGFWPPPAATPPGGTEGEG